MDWNRRDIYKFLELIRRGLYSLVDWNVVVHTLVDNAHVEAYTASWIEILLKAAIDEMILVEAYTASWIEIQTNYEDYTDKAVEAYTASWIEMHLSKRC